MIARLWFAPSTVLVLCASAARMTTAQEAQADTPSAGAMEARAVPATSTIRVDGKLDEPAWASAPAYSAFVQRDPHEGSPVSERTEVRVVYTADALYVGARLYDRQPDLIRARLGRRDEPLDGADYFEVFLDAYHDRLSGYAFRVTAAGAVRDATVDANVVQDASWDAVWESAAVVDTRGWTAEIRIPFAQLSYGTGAADTVWGVQFVRTIARKGESATFPFVPKRVAPSPSRWADLRGLQGLPRSRHIEIIPYASTRAAYLEEVPGNPFSDGADHRMKMGVDVRYRVTNAVVLAATANPDFGHVEVDPARVNLTANELFFPERRPFFVDRADVFRFGQMRAFISPGGLQTFHSRRIGRAPQRTITGRYAYVDAPDEVTIATAVKLTGRTTGGLSIGFVDALTTAEHARFATASGVRGEAQVEPLTNYLVARARQELRGGKTIVGALVTAVNRDVSDSALAATLRRDGYFAGIDFQQSWKNREWSLDGAWGTSVVGGTQSAIAATQRSPVRYLQRPDRTTHRFDPSLRRLSGVIWQLAFAKNAGKHWFGSASYREVAPGVETNDVGFEGLAGFRGAGWKLGYKDDKPRRHVRSYSGGPYGFHFWNWDGFRGNQALGMVWADAVLANFSRVYIESEHSIEGFDSAISRGGPVMRRPERHYWEAVVTSDRRREWVANLAYEHTRDVTGLWSDWYSTSFDWRPRSELRINVGPTFTRRGEIAQYVTQAHDTSATRTFGRRYVFASLSYAELSLVSRVDWTFSPALSLQVFGQPLAAAGRYSDFKSLRRPRTLEFDRFTEAEGTLVIDDPAVVVMRTTGATIRVQQPNFNARSLVGNAVLRWEYRAGSTLFLVWQQRRSANDPSRDFSAAHDLTSIFRQRPDNVFALKATYWIGR